MSEITGRQPQTMREEIVQNNGPSREEQDKLTKRKRIACCFCLVVCIIGYICFLKIVDFFTSYIEFRCFIINSTVIETISCNGYNTSPLFLARWTVNISQDHFVPHHYLSQINQRFTFYYKAQEVISTTHIVSRSFSSNFSWINFLLFRLALKTNATSINVKNTMSTGKNKAYQILRTSFVSWHLFFYFSVVVSLQLIQ